MDLFAITGATASATGIATQTAAGFERVDLDECGLAFGSSATGTAGDDILSIATERPLSLPGRWPLPL